MAADERPARRRPVDAAALIVIRRRRGSIRVLTGRRSGRHVFMPGMTVFPGGRVDRGDYAVHPVDALHRTVEARLLARLPGRRSPSRAMAIAAAGLRETAEEAGLLIGRSGGVCGGPRLPGWTMFAENGVVPDLSPLRLIARAVTPPGLVRRFDARFFAVFENAVAATVPPLDDELSDLGWHTVDEARAAPMAPITRLVLDTLDERLARDPRLLADEPVPFYYTRGKRIVCDRI